MSTARTRLAVALSATAIAALALAGCASSDPLTGDDGTTDEPGASGPIVIGSQAHYSNEIIAEIHAQALEGAGYEVERNFNINTELRVNRGSSSASSTSFMTMDSTDGDISTIYHLAWQECPAKK